MCFAVSCAKASKLFQSVSTALKNVCEFACKCIQDPFCCFDACVNVIAKCAHNLVWALAIPPLHLFPHPQQLHNQEVASRRRVIRPKEKWHSPNRQVPRRDSKLTFIHLYAVLHHFNNCTHTIIINDDNNGNHNGARASRTWKTWLQRCKWHAQWHTQQ